MGKKGSLNLGITALVVLIISIVVLASLLIVSKNIFTRSEKEFNSIKKHIHKI